MAASPAVAAQTQIAMRAGNVKSTAARIIPSKAASHPMPRSAARVDGCRSIRLQDGAAQRCVAGIGRDISTNEITRNVRIGQFQKLHEGGAFIATRPGMPFAQITQQQEVEFLHAAPAAPLQPAKFWFGALIGTHC